MADEVSFFIKHCTSNLEKNLEDIKCQFYQELQHLIRDIDVNVILNKGADNIARDLLQQTITNYKPIVSLCIKNNVNIIDIVKLVKGPCDIKFELEDDSVLNEFERVIDYLNMDKSYMFIITSHILPKDLNPDSSSLYCILSFRFKQNKSIHDINKFLESALPH